MYKGGEGGMLQGVTMYNTIIIPERNSQNTKGYIFL